MKVGQQVTHVVNDQKQGLITGILHPDNPGIRVCWENLEIKWHDASELIVRPPKVDTKMGFGK